VRVLHCIKSLSGGGAEKQLRLLIDATAQVGVASAVACFKQADRDLLPNGTALYLGRKCSLFWPPTWGAMDRAVREFKPDVVQAWLPPSATVPALFFAWRHGVPAIFCYRNSMRVRGMRGLLEWLCCAFFAVRIVTNNCEANSSALYRWLYRRKSGLRIGNIVLSARHHQFPRGRDATKPLRLIYVGRLARQKNVDCVIRALALLRRDGINVELAICGDGRQGGALRGLAQQLGVGDAVHFLGRRGDIDEQLRLSDLLVLASWREGVPNVVLEAWQNGTPCLISDIPAHRDLVGSSGAAQFFDPGLPSDLAARIRVLKDDSEQMSTMARGGMDVLSGMTPDVVARKYQRLYNEMVMHKT
jgi:glycosyltransferase involved in cell wall biosynthesis